jgi:hypothetical protein
MKMCQYRAWTAFSRSSTHHAENIADGLDGIADNLHRVLRAIIRIRILRILRTLFLQRLT